MACIWVKYQLRVVYPIERGIFLKSIGSRSNEVLVVQFVKSSKAFRIKILGAEVCYTALRRRKVNEGTTVDLDQVSDSS